MIYDGYEVTFNEEDKKLSEMIEEEIAKIKMTPEGFRKLVYDENVELFWVAEKDEVLNLFMLHSIDIRKPFYAQYRLCEFYDEIPENMTPITWDEFLAIVKETVKCQLVNRKLGKPFYKLYFSGQDFYLAYPSCEFEKTKKWFTLTENFPPFVKQFRQVQVFEKPDEQELVNFLTINSLWEELAEKKGEKCDI